MPTITYHLYLEQPLLATQLAGDPNSSVSFPYIPGSLIRGMLAHRFIEHHKLGGKDLFHKADAAAPRLFFSPHVRFLNAYPLTEGEQRTLPTPLALQRRKTDDLPKTEPLDLYDLSHQEANNVEREAFVGDDRLAAIAQPFCRIAEGHDLLLYELEPNRIAVHVDRDRPKGRATATQGTVFRYEALAEGQWFGGAILIDQADPGDLQLLKEQLEESPRAWLGRSRSANYGRVQIRTIEVHPTAWREADGAPAPIDAGQVARITLLSDTLLRNEGSFVSSLAQQPWGIHSAAQPWIADQILSGYLGVPIQIDPARTITDSIQVGGYNRTARLPLNQEVALRAGSVITFRPAAALDRQRIDGLEWRGIGERRTEGYGRITFSEQPELMPAARRGILLRRAITEQADLSPLATAMARQMARRLLDQRIDEGIQRFVRDHVVDRGLGPLPANSQLGRVRVLVRSALNTPESNSAAVADALGAFQETARAQFQRARFGETSLWDWLLGMLREPEARNLWARLGITPGDTPTIARQRADLDALFTRRCALRLIEAVLVAISRKSRREREEVRG